MKQIIKYTGYLTLFSWMLVSSCTNYSQKQINRNRQLWDIKIAVDEAYTLLADSEILRLKVYINILKLLP